MLVSDKVMQMDIAKGLEIKIKGTGARKGKQKILKGYETVNSYSSKGQEKDVYSSHKSKELEMVNGDRIHLL